MKQLLLAAAIVTMAACNNANNQNSNADSTSMGGDSSTANTAAAKSDTGWTPLFNGSSLGNWHNYGKSAPDSTWRVDSNAIHLVPAKGEGGDLVTNDTYGNFDLKLQWKIS